MSKKDSYYISLGAGHNQKPLIMAAKKKGFKVIGVDKNINAEAMHLCDMKIQDSILNYKDIYSTILQNFPGEKIEGAFAATYGMALLSLSFLVDQLNLHGLNQNQTRLLVDKCLLRNKIKKIQNRKSLIRQPYFNKIDSRMSIKDLKEMNYPLLVKDRNGYAKKNIFMAKNYYELRKILNRDFLMRKKLFLHDLLLENFIKGPEITVVGFVENFNYHLICILDKTTSSEVPFIDLEHSYPSKFKEMQQYIIKMHQEIVDSFQMLATPLVSEWKYFEGEFYLIEISPQIPGEYIGSFFIPKILKYDYFANLINLTIGEPIQKPPPQAIKKSVKIQFWDKKQDDETWKKQSKKASFVRILNKKAHFPPRDNHDRYGVMVFVDK